MSENKWEAGTLYNTKEDFKEAITRLKFIKNDKERIRVRNIQKTVKENPKYKLKDIVERSKRKWNVNVSKVVASKVKKKALNHLHGSFQEQFRRLYDYCHELKMSNPHSTVLLKVYRPPGYDAKLDTLLPSRNMLPKFGRLYICFEAYLGRTNKCKSYTFITDQQKGLLPTFDELLPGVDHRFCIRYLYNNFRKQFPRTNLKEKMWKEAKATYPQAWERAMKDIQKINDDAYKYLIKIPPRFWSKSQFSFEPKCDVLVNNVSEAFNSVILDARGKTNCVNVGGS
ncbi:hypothetical protein K1719_022617 [Acacia pycnantha]|nr:hypothetical protein K1719_022617 [Acacia pycnantha]